MPDIRTMTIDPRGTADTLPTFELAAFEGAAGIAFWALMPASQRPRRPWRSYTAGVSVEADVLAARIERAVETTAAAPLRLVTEPAHTSLPSDLGWEDFVAFAEATGAVQGPPFPADDVRVEINDAARQVLVEEGIGSMLKALTTAVREHAQARPGISRVTIDRSVDPEIESPTVLEVTIWVSEMGADKASGLWTSLLHAIDSDLVETVGETETARLFTRVSIAVDIE